MVYGSSLYCNKRSVYYDVLLGKILKRTSRLVSADKFSSSLLENMTLVIALPLRHPSNMGNEHDIYSEKWQESASETTSTSCKSTKVLASLKLTNGDSERELFSRGRFHLPALSHLTFCFDRKSSKVKQ